MPVAWPMRCWRARPAACRKSLPPARTNSLKWKRNPARPRPDRSTSNSLLSKSGVAMAEITAGMVKELREKTDAPMMECKKALTEAVGDMAKAEEILRVKLGNKASKAAARVAAEGIVGIHVSADRKLAAMVELNCETDFVAKNDDFIAFAKSLAELVAKDNPADVSALAKASLGGKPVEEVRTALV